MAVLISAAGYLSFSATRELVERGEKTVIYSRSALLYQLCRFFKAGVEFFQIGAEEWLTPHEMAEIVEKFIPRALRVNICPVIYNSQVERPN